MIDSFQGPYRFLSNFYPSIVDLDGVAYPTVEHAYQAAKTTDWDEQKAIRDSATPGAAKRAGRHVKIRPEWEDIKLSVMKVLVIRKFRNSHKLMKLLLGTKPHALVEGNRWHDTFWGRCYCSKCNGSGENHLGRILMEIRDI